MKAPSDTRMHSVHCAFVLLFFYLSFLRCTKSSPRRRVLSRNTAVYVYVYVKSICTFISMCKSSCAFTYTLIWSSYSKPLSVNSMKSVMPLPARSQLTPRTSFTLRTHFTMHLSCHAKNARVSSATTFCMNPFICGSLTKNHTPSL